MNEIILLKSGEIALKGQNKNTFEEMLIKNVKRKLAPLGAFTYWKAQSTTYVTPQGEVDLEEALERIGKVFGIAAYCRALVVPKDFDEIKAAAPAYLEKALLGAKTFKVESRRSDKTFPMQSPEISCLLGEHLLQAFGHLKVDVLAPEIVVMVEIRERAAYIHAAQTPGAGGIPVGSSGKAALLISGGIDSPVAGYMMARRGLEISAVHFESPPYTSERAREKVRMLLEKLTPYCGRIRWFVVPFTKIQEEIRRVCPEELFTVLMRRSMMRIASAIAQQNGMGALITGESVGQVASQTMYAIACTDTVTPLPVFRPVIGMDKMEIVEIARKIDTFETSILPYEDCCTVFTPRHPRTRPRIEQVEQAEQAFAFTALEEAAAAQMSVEWVRGERDAGV